MGRGRTVRALGRLAHLADDLVDDELVHGRGQVVGEGGHGCGGRGDSALRESELGHDLVLEGLALGTLLRSFLFNSSYISILQLLVEDSRSEDLVEVRALPYLPFPPPTGPRSDKARRIQCSDIVNLLL